MILLFITRLVESANFHLWTLHSTIMKFEPIPTYTLNDGNKMPGIGMGCFMGYRGDGEETARTVKIALELGYRHIDTATRYQNEISVGRSIAESGVPREELFVVTKLAMPDHGRVEAALDRSLNALGLEYIDLYLMHWPQADDPETGRTLRPNESPTFVETWLEMEKLPLTGKTKSIGICNFSIKNLEILLSKANIVPAVHQIEIHPCLPNFALIQYSKANGIVVAGYTPMGKGSAPFYSDPTFLSLASKYEVQIGQILLSWAIQRGTIPIPKSSNEERARQNLQIIKLAQEDMNIIDEYHKQPGMHRSHSLIGSIKDGKLLGWTMDELGWPYDDDGYVKS